MRPLLIVLPVFALSLLACLGGEDPPVTPPEPTKSADPAPKVEPATPVEPPTPVEPTGELRSSAIGESDVPPGSELLGEVVGGARWTDSEGENLLVLTEVPEHGSGKDADMRGAELYGYRLVRRGGAWSQAWKIQDFVKECPNDITASHVVESVRVTDLDADGIGETSFVYRIACRGDVSPATQKLMMHEGTTKLALRGQAYIDAGGQGFGGDYEVDPAFDKAPPVFLSHAKRLWASFRKETF